MEKRVLGKSELEVSAVGLGCMNMSKEDQNSSSKKEMMDIIRKAYDMGVTLFDTAEVYGPFLNEQLVGEALQGIRNKVAIATKCGVKVIGGKQVVDGRPEEIRKSVEGSLKRLQTDYIDLYYLHRVDSNVPIEEVAGTMQDICKQGKIRHWGLSEPGLDTIRRANKVFPITAIQSEYSMMFREPENEIIPLLEELNIGLVPFSPLAKGFLTGKEDGSYTSTIQAKTRFSQDNLKHNAALREIVLRFAKEKQATPAQISLAWVMAQKPWIVPIPGTTKMHRMEENIGAAMIKLSESEIKEMNQQLDLFEVAGERYEPGSEWAKRVRI